MDFEKLVKVSSEIYFQEVRNDITRMLVESKNEFQKIDENDIDVLRERLDSFCKNLRLVWETLNQYAVEKKRQEITKELQSYVDKGLRFQTVKIDCEQFHLEYNGNDVAKVVPSTGEDTHDIPF